MPTLIMCKVTFNGKIKSNTVRRFDVSNIIIKNEQKNSVSFLFLFLKVRVAEFSMSG